MSRTCCPRRTVLAAAMFGLGAAGLPAPTVLGSEAPDNVLSGRVVLPDGTPAQAAVVDLAATVGGVAQAAFTRAVTDTDGVYRVPIPATEELAAAASLNGGVLEFQATISDLAEAVGRAGATAFQTVEYGKATLDRTHTIGTPPRPGHFDIDDETHDAFAKLQPAVTDVLRVAQAVGNLDRDMLLGNDDVNDPDLVPPLGAVLVEVVNAVAPGAGQVGTCGALTYEQGEETQPGESIGTSTVDVCMTDHGLYRQVDEGDRHRPLYWGDGCAPVSALQWGRRGARLPGRLDGEVTLLVLECDDKHADFDYYSYAWEAHVTPDEVHTLWRFKVRTEATNDNYRAFNVDPTGDVPLPEDKDTWAEFDVQVGPLSIPVGGGDSAPGPGKIHEWDNRGRNEPSLVHISYISGFYMGSGYKNGPYPVLGGWYYTVPPGNPGWQAYNSVQAWVCDYSGEKAKCDKH